MAKQIEDYKIGDKVTFGKTLTEADIAMFGAATGDMYPLHFNEKLASKTVFGGRIAHGVLTTGIVSALTGTPLHGIGAYNAVLREIYTKFLYPVRAGDTITAEATITEVVKDRKIVKMDVICTNQDAIKVASGFASVKLLD